MMNLLDLIVGKKNISNPKNTYSNVFKIFLVDDNEAFSRLIENYILSKIQPQHKNTLFEIIKFTNGDECINNLGLNPNLIFLDYYITDNINGDGNGDKIFLKLKAIDSSIPTVILSGLEESNLVKQLINQGLHSFIFKDEDMLTNLETIINKIIKS